MIMPRKTFIQRLGEDIVDEVVQQTFRAIFKPKPTKFCKNCGNGITPGSGRRTWCSDYCAKENTLNKRSSKKSQNNNIQTRVCKSCHIVLPTGSDQCFCK